MKHLFLTLSILLSLAGYAQHSIELTEKISVEGEVVNPMELTLEHLKTFPSQEIGDVLITNHMGIPKGTITGLKGIPISEVLKTLEVKSDSPKLLSEYYLVFQASDGYKVVYSWNELFNSETGSNTFIVTEKEGVPMEKMEERIMVITPKDIQTGRRYIKSLKTIKIYRAP